ncbi:MAG: VWA domain-containing protein [Acidobacteriota bacterium]
MSEGAATGFFLAAPAWLLLLVLLPLLIWARRRRALPALTYSRLPTGARGGWPLHLAFALRLCALALILLALARPQLGEGWEQQRQEGIDLQLVLDVSGSMAAEDFQPRNRLHVAQRVVKDFIARRGGDRIGLVIFAGAALTRSPLTTDHRALERIVDRLEIGELPDGTALGVALATAVARLEDTSIPAASEGDPRSDLEGDAGEPPTRVVVLVTDGANNRGEIAPSTAAALAESLEIRVYTVGVGTDERVPITRTFKDPATGRERTERRYQRVEVDEDLLSAIARQTGGRFFRATDAAALERVFDEIDDLETQVILSERRLRRRELYRWPAAAAIVCLLLAPLTAVLGWGADP